MRGGTGIGYYYRAIIFALGRARAHVASVEPCGGAAELYGGQAEGEGSCAGCEDGAERAGALCEGGAGGARCSAWFVVVGEA